MQEFQSNLTLLRTLKRTILQKMNVARLLRACLFVVMFKLVSVFFAGVSVAHLPFEPLWIAQRFLTYKMDLVQADTFFIGSNFLFVLTFFTCKKMIRKLFFNHRLRLRTRDSLSMSLPRSALFQFNKSMSWSELLQTLLGLLFSVFYSLYNIYKALKKYKDIKYTISVTRNVSRLTGFFCSLWLPVPLRYVMYGSFAWFYGINMQEVEDSDFGNYPTFTQFFTRKLKPGVRTLSEPEVTKSMCSPCDGRVLSCGVINSQFSTIDCVKGRSYRLDEFMLGVKGDSLHND